MCARALAVECLPKQKTARRITPSGESQEVSSVIEALLVGRHAALRITSIAEMSRQAVGLLVTDIRVNVRPEDAN
jgi:hypothetical protein